MNARYAWPALALGLSFSSGCIGGALATSTGPRRSGAWSESGHQAAHVGETVKFSFILAKTFAKAPIHPAGLAEYCMLHIDDQPIEMELNDAGKFAASYRMPADWAGREVRLRATAYRQYGQRDRVVRGSQLLESDRTSDPRDRAVAGDAITMLVYQSSVEIKVKQQAEKESDQLDLNAATLVLRKADGASSTVPNAEASGTGFNVEGPTDAGDFTVRYRPSFAQVNPTGRTEAELAVHDRAGRPHRYRADFMTP